jgi:hypothetical protein
MGIPIWGGEAQSMADDGARPQERQRTPAQ